MQRSFSGLKDLMIVLGVLLATLALFGPMAGPAAGASRILGPGAATDPPEVTVSSKSPVGMRVEFTLPALAVEDVQAGDQTFQAIAIPGGGDTGDPGSPALPTFGRFVIVPDRAGVTVSATVRESEELPGFRVAPVQGEDATTFAYDPAAYGRVGYGDAPLVTAGEPALLRGLRVVPVSFAPVQYDPSRGTLRIVRRMSVEVTYTGEDSRNPSTKPAPPTTPSFDAIYRSLVLGYDTASKSEPLHHGSYLVICPNDQGVIDRLQPLLAWRRRQGFPVTLATTAVTGTSTTSIKAYIQNAYDNWTDPPEFIVLAADATTPYVLPTFHETLSGQSGEGDHPYSQLDGTDLLSDAHVGRLSFSTYAELETIVAKTVGYESTPYMDNTDWFRRACLVGDPNDSGYSTVQVQQWIKTRLLEMGYSQVDTVFSGSFVSQMTTALNRGDTFFCYRGYYLMSGWSNSNTSALTNGWKLPFACISTCGTGSFASGTSRSEGFLRAGSSVTPRGAVGCIGTATTGTHTRFNNCFTYGVFWGALYQGAHEMGAAHTWGKLNLYLNYPTQLNWATIFSYWNNLMGDPACDIYTSVPAALTVDHPASLPVGATACGVAVTEGGVPRAGARVCLYRTVTGGEIQVSGITDEQGWCELAIPPAEAGSFQLTVSGHDLLPYKADVPVAVQNLFVGYQASTVDDDESGESVGDGSGVVNPGETIELRVQLENHGTALASGVSAVLTTEDPYVEITDASENFGNIPGGGSAWCADDFGFLVRGGCPHGRTLRFGLDATDGSATWHSIVEVPVVSAEIQYVAYTVSNAGPGGILDPSETANLAVTVRNDGGIPADGTTAVLLSRSEYMDIPENAATFPTLNPGLAQSNAFNPFTVHAAPNCPRGQEVWLRLALDFNGVMRDTVDFAITVGTKASTDPIGPDGYGYYAYDNTDVSYPEAPVYSWIEIDPNLGGTGTQVQLGDYSDYQDKSRQVTLPFAFGYYGQSYTTATICSNGWVVMGSTYLTDYRNWTIPSPGGPNGVIAVFWDDLIEVTSPAGHVYQLYDAAQHVWIVEWSRMRNIMGSPTETVQAVFYDPAYYPTETGDGMILFQYQAVSNTDGTDGYSTVGLEKPDNSDGLLYTYFNQYPAGAATLTPNRAIKFVPKVEHLTGVVGGTVRNASAGGAPLAGATVTILQNGHQFVSGVDGAYQFTESAGSYTLVADLAGFAPDTASVVDLPSGGSVALDFLLDDVVAPAAAMVQAAASSPDTLATHTVRISAQDMSGLSAVTLHYRIYNAPFQSVTMAPDGGDFYRAEIPAQRWTSRIDYYVEVVDGGGNAVTLPALGPDAPYRFWVGPLLTAWADDCESDAGWTVGSLGDDATSGIWERCDPNGTWLFGEPVQTEDDHSAAPGTMCWVTGNAPAGADQDADDVDGGTTTLVSPRIDCTIDGTVLLKYWDWYTNATGAPGDIWRVQVSNDDGASWVDLDIRGSSHAYWVFHEVDLGAVIAPTSQVRVRFVASDAGDPTVIEAAVDDLEISYIGLTPSGVTGGRGATFGFASGSPNPVRPGSRVAFSTDHAGPVALDVFDIQGRNVRRLFEGSLPAGSHVVAWDGPDDRGRPLATGIYFQRLTAGTHSQTRKILVIQ